MCSGPTRSVPTPGAIPSASTAGFHPAPGSSSTTRSTSRWSLEVPRDVVAVRLPEMRGKGGDLAHGEGLDAGIVARRPPGERRGHEGGPALVTGAARKRERGGVLGLDDAVHDQRTRRGSEEMAPRLADEDGAQAGARGPARLRATSGRAPGWLGRPRATSEARGRRSRRARRPATARGSGSPRTRERARRRRAWRTEPLPYPRRRPPADRRTRAAARRGPSRRGRAPGFSKRTLAGIGGGQQIRTRLSSASSPGGCEFTGCNTAPSSNRRSARRTSTYWVTKTRSS